MTHTIADIYSSLPTGPRASRRPWIALAVLALPLLLVSMDVSVLYFAVPQISEDLGASATQQLWIFDIYGFVLAGLLITMGAVADRVGARRLLLGGALAFSLTSVAAAFSQSAGELIAARALLGVAGATLMPSTLSMIRSLFTDDRQRATAVALWTGVMTAGVGLGPVISGLLLERFWWGSVFLINIPAMALLLLVGPFLLPPVARRRDSRFDIPSALLSLGAVLPSVYGVKEWAAQGFETRYVACLVLGAVLAVVFARRQLTHDSPLLAPDLLRNRAFIGAVGANAVGTFALVGNAVFMTAYLQLVLGKGPLESALWSLLPTVGVGVAIPVASMVARHHGRRIVVVGGLLLGAAGFGVLTRVGTHALWPTLVGAGVLAAGLVSVMTMASDVVLAAVRPEQAGSGAAVSESATELGGALGIALLGSVGAAAYRSDVHDRLPAALAHGPAGQSLAGAISVAEHLPAPLSRSVVAAGRIGYVHGLHAAALVGAVTLLVSAIGVLAARGRD
jgi:DHA2 family multidrug resistance protein-like MFS transporter